MILSQIEIVGNVEEVESLTKSNAALESENEGLQGAQKLHDDAISEMQAEIEGLKEQLQNPEIETTEETAEEEEEYSEPDDGHAEPGQELTTGSGYEQDDEHEEEEVHLIHIDILIFLMFVKARQIYN